jgi:hypothetical protein
MTDAPEPSTSPAASRMRRHRQRRRDGLRCLVVELRETEIDALILRELLNPGRMPNDAGAVADALYAHLDRTLGQMAGIAAAAASDGV